MPAPFSSPFVTIDGRCTCPCSSMVCCRHPTLRQFFPLLSPTAYFLPTAAKSMQKMPPETDGFWTSFCVQELLPKFRRSRESAFFYSRCRYIGWLKGVVLLPGESILPSGRTTSFFIWAGAAAGLLLSQFPRHLISNETLEGKGNPKTIGFCWRSLVPFCPETDTHHFSRIFLCFFR